MENALGVYLVDMKHKTTILCWEYVVGWHDDTNVETGWK